MNKVETEAELHSLRRSVKRGLQFGDDTWPRSSAVRLGLETTNDRKAKPMRNLTRTYPLFRSVDAKRLDRNFERLHSD